MKGLTLTQREQTRLQVLNRLAVEQMTTGEAAAILGLSERHAWRMLAAYRKEGAAALTHGNRGRRPRQRRCRGDSTECNCAGTDAVCRFQSHSSGRDLVREGGCGAESFHSQEHAPERGVTQPAIPAIPTSRDTGVKGCPRKGCSSSSMVVTTPGWRTEGPGSHCCWRSTMPLGRCHMESSVSERTPTGTSSC